MAETKAVKAVLDRILASRAFARSPRLRRFLRHVVDERLAGRADKLSGYAIGLDVFDRPADFDPTTDTIVRVEARRLRQTLDSYYAEEGVGDPIQVSVPRGGYAPVFLERAVEAAASSVASTIARPRHGPAVVVLPFENYSGQPEDDCFANGLTEQLIATLSRFSELSVVSRTSAFAYRDVSIGEIREALDVDYVFEGSIRKSDDTLRLTAQFIDAETDTHLWSTTFDRSLADADLFAIEDDLSARVAARIADRYGPIGRVGGRAKQRVSPSFEVYSSLLAFHDYYARHDPKAHLEARLALERGLELDPEFAEGWAALAAVHLDEYRLGFNPMPTNGDPLDRALRVAAHAVILDPECATGHQFLACARFHNGDDAGFRQSAEEALRLNPGHADLLADVGSYLYFLGDVERGGELITRAIALNPVHPGWYRVPMFFEAYTAGRFEQALGELRRAPMKDFFWWRAFKAATHARLGEQDSAADELKALLSMQPDFQSRFVEEARKWRVDDAVLSALAAGLEDAGIVVR